jgi:TolB-like protein/DNA-binding winged helix-turn-helix (wHTH) protein
VESLLLKEGVPVSLSPKAFEILCVLVRRSGHLVSKEDLLREVWPDDKFIEESNLARNIYLLRKILGEGADGQSYIQTVPRKGYRFAAQVRPLGTETVEASALPQGTAEDRAGPDAIGQGGAVSASSAVPEETPPRMMHPQRRFRLSALRVVPLTLVLLLATTAALYLFLPRNGGSVQPVTVRSLAVLPFKSIDAQSGDEQIGLGMADAILTRLSKLPDISVLPTTSVFKYSGGVADPIAVGRELGVDVVLDGTMQRSGNHIRVTAQLVSVRDSKTLWADKFDEPLTDIFALQDTVSEQVSRIVAPKIAMRMSENTSKRYTKDPEAYESYLLGFYFWNKRTKENIAKAIPYLQRAVEKDPNFALAQAILADCYFINGYYGYNIYPVEESFDKAKSLASNAIELDDTIAESHILMGYLKAGLEGDPVGAEIEYKRGLELNPNYAPGHISYGYELFNALRLDEAVREVRRGQELDPVSARANSALCFMLIMARDYDGAIKYGRRSVELGALSPVARVNLGEALLHKKMYQEAIIEFQELSKENQLLGRRCLARAYAEAGERAKAQALLAWLLRHPQSIASLPLEMAAIYTSLGQVDNAFKLLNKVKWDRTKIALLHFDPQWDSLRSDQRFANLLRNIEAPK